MTEDDTIENYLLALIKHVEPEKIRYASRISNARLCVYFDNKLTVDEFIQKSGQITLNNKHITARRLVNPSKKLIISGVFPDIPNEAIEKALASQINLKLCSPITHLRGSYTTPALQNIHSFRRSVWYNDQSDDEPNIPQSLVIKYGTDEEHRIFLTTEQTVKCFLCQEHGHLAKSCSKTQNTRKHSGENPSGELLEHPTNMDITLPSRQEKTDTANEFNLLKLPKKRPPPSSSASSNDNEKTTSNNQTETNVVETEPLTTPEPQAEPQKPSDTAKHTTKKAKTTNQAKDLQLDTVEVEKITALITTLKTTGFCQLTFNADDLIKFLHKIRSSRDKLASARGLTKDLQTLNKVIEEIKPRVKASTKRTLTALQKTIENGRHESESSGTEQ